MPRLPGLSLPQGIARQLVGAAALLFITAPAVATWAGTAHATPQAAPAGGVAGATSIGATSIAEGDAPGRDAAAQDTDEAGPATVTHRVTRGETLWSIAEQHLGEGTRYTEIVELNRDTVPSSHWIRPGQTLRLPAAGDGEADAGDDGAGTHTVERGDTLWEIAEEELGSGARYPELVEATDQVEQPDGLSLIHI